MDTVGTDRYDSHEAVAALLPWYVNGALEAAEHALVERHLEICLRCRAALNAERRLANSVREVEVETMAARQAFSDLRHRLAGDEPPRRPGFADLLAGAAGWLLRPAAAACLAIAALLVTLPSLMPGPGAPAAGGEYRTLAASRGNYDVEATQLRVVFAGSIDTAAREAILAGADARIVTGPSAHGVYTVAPAAVTAEPPADLLALLRADPGVVFVEPVLRPAADDSNAP